MHSSVSNAAFTKVDRTSVQTWSVQSITCRASKPTDLQIKVKQFAHSPQRPGKGAKQTLLNLCNSINVAKTQLRPWPLINYLWTSILLQFFRISSVTPLPAIGKKYRVSEQAAKLLIIHAKQYCSKICFKAQIETEISLLNEWSVTKINKQVKKKYIKILCCELGQKHFTAKTRLWGQHM